jgi:hypothetical protein
MGRGRKEILKAKLLKKGILRATLKKRKSDKTER